MRVLLGEVAIQCRFGNADRGGQFCRRDTLASIAGFQHQRQRLKYFLATVPFRSLFFCHVTKYPLKISTLPGGTHAMTANEMFAAMYDVIRMRMCY